MFKIAFKLVALGICFLTFFGTNSAQTDGEKAIEMYRSGDYQTAITLLEDLHKSGKADRSSAMYLGAAYVQVGEKNKASAVFKNLPKTSSLTSIAYDKEVKFTKRPIAKFSEYVAENERTGFIRLAIELKNDGSVGFVFPFMGTSKNFIKPGVDAAKAIKFKPAELNGRAVTVVIMMDYKYNMHY